MWKSIASQTSFMNFLLPSLVLAWPHLATAGRAENWSLLCDEVEIAVALPLLVTASWAPL